MTALHYAAENGQVNLINQLLDMGADVQATDEDVRSATGPLVVVSSAPQRSPSY
jgi:ankyrin repeat protein